MVNRCRSLCGWGLSDVSLWQCSEPTGRNASGADKGPRVVFLSVGATVALLSPYDEPRPLILAYLLPTARTPMACAMDCVLWSSKSQLMGHAAGAAAFTSARAPPA